ncbi:hypothetical protein GE061_007173 [Apolygus lucorum]|uniref:Glutamyl-tRNA(Gln) amidotransferase subunit C, mitochondrial n=1 Tax=Apolygus lucorum TaxID=248454 RepID=A0A8S9WSS3_APOLU|nr:hypothetical protein GE061_007173 [Apolygus lucorum]
MKNVDYRQLSGVVMIRLALFLKPAHIQRGTFCSLVPDKPVVPDRSKLPEPTRIDAHTIEQLERNSLVDFGNEEGIRIVEEAIRFADQLSLVDTEGVEPLTSVLEDRALRLRNDAVNDGGCQKLILSNAKVAEEGYFVAPPGNVPLETKTYDLKHTANIRKAYGFVRVVGSKKVDLKFGPPGELVFQNLRNEWLHSTTTYREINVFPYHMESESSANCENIYQDLKSAFSLAKFLSGNSPPFGIAFSRTTKDRTNDDPLFPRRHVELKQIVFEKPQVSKQYFYRHLQQRKRWWRKFSADPGRFSFGDVTRISESSVAEEAQILVTFPWGTHEVEKVRFLGSEELDKLPVADQNDYTVSNDKKRGLPHVIESYFNLDYGALTYMFDAFYERKSGRPVLKFHRKLSPYKYGFAAGSVSSAVAQELYDMSRMICLDLKKESLGCLFPSPQEFGKKGLETQLAKHDALGICYTVVLNEGSLKSGLCGLYNRETTLQEQTHISKLPEYCSLIMKNY